MYIQFSNEKTPRDQKKKIAQQMQRKCIQLREETLEHRKQDKIHKKIQSGFKSDSDDIYDSGNSMSSDDDLTDAEAFQQESDKIQYFDQVKLVYITFKSMETKDLIE